MCWLVCEMVAVLKGLLTHFTWRHHQNNLRCAILMGNVTVPIQWSAHFRRRSIYTLTHCQPKWRACYSRLVWRACKESIILNQYYVSVRFRDTYLWCSCPHFIQIRTKLNIFSVQPKLDSFMFYFFCKFNLGSAPIFVNKIWARILHWAQASRLSSPFQMRAI